MTAKGSRAVLRGGGDGNVVSLPDNVRLYWIAMAKAGAKLFIKPSKASIQKMRDRLRQEWHSLTEVNVRAVIQRLAPIITGWANYYKTGVSAKTFTSLDHYLIRQAWRYTKRQHPTKKAQWRYAKYFGRRNPRRTDRWVFGDSASGKYLPKFSWTKIQRHVLVKPSTRETQHDTTRVTCGWCICTVTSRSITATVRV